MTEQEVDQDWDVVSSMRRVLERNKDKHENLSHVKVYAALTLTPEGREVWDRYVRYYLNMEVVDYFFHVTSPEDVRTNLHIRGVADHVSYDRLTLHAYWVDADKAVPWEDAAAVAFKHFGKGIPTYNIDSISVLGPDFYEKCHGKLSSHRRDAFSAKKNHRETYAQWVVKAVNKQCEALRTRTLDRLKAQADVIMGSDAYAEAMRNAVLDRCKADVKAVMSRYSCLGDDVLRSALQEYVISDVMDL